MGEKKYEAKGGDICINGIPIAAVSTQVVGVREKIARELVLAANYHEKFMFLLRHILCSNVGTYELALELLAEIESEG